jgi:uncharacterized membrane protein YphA (DoxX/SURF4 family)
MTTAPVRPATDVLPPALLLARGLAALRIFVGVIALANGLAKVFGWHNVWVGPYRGFLINLQDARGILEFEVFEKTAGGGEGTMLPLLRPLTRVLLDNWAVVGPVLTVTEVVTGLLLVTGLATRPAALVALGQHLFLAAIYFSSNRWVFEQPHEYVPLAILVLVPAGRAWGLDGRLRRRRQAAGLDPAAGWRRWVL